MSNLPELLGLALERARSLRSLPGSTYRLQFHAGFTFRDATKIVPYLAQLGITHIYASPYLAARAGSTHGYDVIDASRLNPEIGSDDDYAAFLDAMRREGLHHILDTVPNHAGVDTNDNRWWNNILEYGRASPYARYFDIAWRGSTNPLLRDRVLAPILGQPYGKALEAGELKLIFQPDAGAFSIKYFERSLPICPASYDLILNAQNQTPGSGDYGPAGRRREPNRDDSAPAECKNLIDSIARLRSPSPGARNRREADEFIEICESIKTRLRALAADGRLNDVLARSLDVMNGTPGDPRSFDLLDTLLRRQNYRLSWWQVASEEINYRRFFDINGLAALAMERDGVFEATHAFTLKLAAEGKVAGLRIDHPDGLYDPKEYLQRLQVHFVLACAKEIAARQPEYRDVDWAEFKNHIVRQSTAFNRSENGRNDRPLYVVVEKILALGERLPLGWQCHGTSGYDFLAMVNELFVDRSREPAFTRIYQSISGQTESYEDLVYRMKRRVLSESLAGDLRMLTRRLARLARRDRRGRDFTFAALHDALRQMIACFPVYRTYIDSHGVREEDQRYLEMARDRAIARNPHAPPDLFQFVCDMLLLRAPEGFNDRDRARQLRFACKFQQLTAPATAKGVEDTSFYIYQRFISLNEVGGDPGRFGMDPAELHKYLAERQRAWPHAMNVLSTHDTKRSEDVRARLNVLLEMPQEWEKRVSAWMKMNAHHRQTVRGSPVPSPDEEYLLYQTLVGAWIVGKSSEPDESFVKRISQYMRKALREAKVHTNWTQPDEAWESALDGFIAAILSEARSHEFVADMRLFCRDLAHYGFINSLSQTLLRLAPPGVPDTYQGTEIEDFSLVDPDNRRPVDYNLRRRMLNRLVALDDLAAPERCANVRAMLDELHEGSAKLWTMHQALHCRKDHPALFAEGEYLALESAGSRGRHLFAFARQHADDLAIAVLPRFIAAMAPQGRLPLGDVWADTLLNLPSNFRDCILEDAFTGRKIVAAKNGGLIQVSVGDILADFPIALLYGKSASGH